MGDVRIRVNREGGSLEGQIFTPAFIDDDGDARLTGEEEFRAGRPWLFAYEFEIEVERAEPERRHKVTFELTTTELIAVLKALEELNN